MKTIKTLILLSLLSVAGTASAAFDGAYDLSNWSINTVGDGVVDITNAPTSITLVSNNTSLNNTDQSALFVAVEQAVISFDWDYTTSDVDGPLYDPFAYEVNGVITQLTLDGGPDSQNGSIVFTVFAGDTFGFHAFSDDGLFGSASTTISNFSATPVPIPESTIPLGLALGSMISLGRRNKTDD